MSLFGKDTYNYITNEIDYEKLAQAIVKAKEIEAENERISFKNTKLQRKNKIWCVICVIIAIAFFGLSFLGILFTLFSVFDFGYIKSLTLILPGMLFLLFRYNIFIMYKSRNVATLLSVYSITIAVASLVINVWNNVF